MSVIDFKLFNNNGKTKQISIIPKMWFLFHYDALFQGSNLQRKHRDVKSIDEHWSKDKCLVLQDYYLDFSYG